ncbi:shikimate dehydrogenase [Desulfovibrio ferrophilus]|uniref:Shikimate dehydrogenase (NADP(+)) n=1 Tax=Desulfovibrio ferrophilus TaxID=241368 RepID=A0A2Z6B1P5_9BACT|nr:shikimate dehydrogenase [Desulfovibrio ferrophilus]BBD09395.1 shikimate dehydrogenase [Desulfovibrio ferrophilus]
MSQKIVMPEGGKKLFGIIGHPLGHTMSPPLHNWGFETIGFEGEYRAFPTTPDELPAFMEQVRSLPISGLSVTIPHKVAVQPFLDGLSERVLAVGATNTLYWSGKRLLGENTDVYGFMAPLTQLATRPKSALVLGAGGAARAVIAGLLEIGVSEIVVSNRSADKATDLAAEFSVNTHDWTDRQSVQAELIVNTTPLGMKGERVDQNPLPHELCLSHNQTLYDLVYNPTRTKFLQQGEENGCRTIDGLTMFVHQAVEQFRLWTGQTFDLGEARKLITGMLAQS